MLEHLKTKDASFREILSALEGAEDSLLLSEQFPAAYKAGIVRFILSDPAPRHVSAPNLCVHISGTKHCLLDKSQPDMCHVYMQGFPKSPSDLEWFGSKLASGCKAEVLQSLGRLSGFCIV